MVVFPNAKINLGLSVIAKRSDGFHDLETVFYPVNIRDSLELIPGHPKQSSLSADDSLGAHFSSSGISIDGDTKNNLCLKAVDLLSKDFPDILPVQIHLHKNIPMGAGLGGGSSDAAFTLSLLNDLFQLGLSREQLINYALKLGSDCPFFIINRPCLATGRGEILEEIPLDLSAYQITLINPGIHVNTGWAFSQLSITSSTTNRSSLKEIVARPPEEWKDVLSNDFENPVFGAYPEIGLIRERCYAAGAIYAAMSGSGSTIFALSRPGSFILPDFPAHYRVITTPGSFIQK